MVGSKALAVTAATGLHCNCIDALQRILVLHSKCSKLIWAVASPVCGIIRLVSFQKDLLDLQLGNEMVRQPRVWKPSANRYYGGD